MFFCKAIYVAAVQVGQHEEAPLQHPDVATLIPSVLSPPPEAKVENCLCTDSDPH